MSSNPASPFISLNVLQIKAASSPVKASPDSLYHSAQHTCLQPSTDSAVSLRAGRLPAACPRRSCRLPMAVQGSEPECVPGNGVARNRDAGDGGRGEVGDGPWRLLCQFSKSKAKPNPAN